MTGRYVYMPSLMSRDPLHPPPLPPPQVPLDDLSGLTAYTTTVQKKYLKYLEKNIDDQRDNEIELEKRYDEIAKYPVYYFIYLGLIGLVGLAGGVLFNSDSIFTNLGIVYIAFFCSMGMLYCISLWKLDNLKLRADFIENRRVTLREFVISFIGQLNSFNGTNENASNLDVKNARFRAALLLATLEFNCGDFRKDTLIYIALTFFSAFLYLMAISIWVFSRV